MSETETPYAGEIVTRDSDPSKAEVRVDIPTTDSQGSCYHGINAPCGAERTKTVTISVEALHLGGLYACGRCSEHFDLIRAIDALEPSGEE